MNFEELLPEQLDVTPEQLCRSLRQEPWEVLACCEDKLTDEQINIARKQQNDR